MTATDGWGDHLPRRSHRRGPSQVVVTSSHCCGLPGTHLLRGRDLQPGQPGLRRRAAGGEQVRAEPDRRRRQEGEGARRAATPRRSSRACAVDDACLQKANDTLAKTFARQRAARTVWSRRTAMPPTRRSDAVIAQAIQLVTNGSPGPDVCFGKKLTAIGKKLQGVAKCFSARREEGRGGGSGMRDEGGRLVQLLAEGMRHADPARPGRAARSISSRSISIASRPYRRPPRATTTTSTTRRPRPAAARPAPRASRPTVGTANCGQLSPRRPIRPSPASSIPTPSAPSSIRPRARLPLHRRRRGDGDAHRSFPRMPPRSSTAPTARRWRGASAPAGRTAPWARRAPRSTASTTRGRVQHATPNASRRAAAWPTPRATSGRRSSVNGFPSSCVVNTFSQDASGTLNVATGDSSGRHRARLAGLPDPRQAHCLPDLRRRRLQLRRQRGRGLHHHQHRADQPRLSAGSQESSWPRCPVSLNPLTSTGDHGDGGGRELLPESQAKHPGAFGQADHRGDHPERVARG